MKKQFKEFWIVVFILNLIFTTSAQETIVVKFNYSFLDYDVIDDHSIKNISLPKVFNERAKMNLIIC
jgi:hypothetical protein